MAVVRFALQVRKGAKMKNILRPVVLVAIFAVVVNVLASCSPVVPSPTPSSPPAASTQLPAATSKATDLPATKAPAPPSSPTQKPTTEVPYYSGKTIEIVVDQAAGGGTDTLARIIAPFLTKYLPGNPRSLIRNVPGVAVGQNVFYERGKRDGSTLITSASASIGRQLRKLDVVKYDVTKYRFVGNVSRAESIILVRKGLKARLTDASAPPLVIGTVGGDDSWQAPLMWGREFLGWNVRWILGFGGTSEMELAFRRGELDIIGTANGYIINSFIQEGMAEPVTTLGAIKGDKFLRRPDFPDVPTFVELLGNKKPTGIPWEAFIAWVAPSLVDKWYAAPPATPDNVMSLLTDAFARTAGDPQFDAMVKKMGVAEVYTVGIGKEVETTVKEILASRPEALDYGVELQRKFGIIATK